MTIIIGGKELQFPLSVETYNWKTHPKRCPKTTDVTPRKTFVRGVVVHTVHGTADGGVVHMDLPKDDPDPSDEDLKYTRYQATTSREVSWHFTVDIDGSIAQAADPALETCWHANQTNPFTVGIELVQAKNGDLTDIQLKSFVALIDLLTASDHPNMAIQRQIPMQNGKHYSGIIARLLTENNSGSSVNGIYGHRNVWYRSKLPEHGLKPYRGSGDPGDAPFEALLQAGYEGMDYQTGADRTVWTDRQRALGLAQDGVPGPKVKEALRALGSVSGTYVRRGDELK